MMTLDNRVKRSAWREPMVWLVAAIPAAAVVATIALLVTATRSSGNNDLVADEVQRTAQVQVADLGPDAAAQQLRSVRSCVPARASSKCCRSMAASTATPGWSWRCTILRAPRSIATLPSCPFKTGWRSDGEIDLSHDWNVELRPADGAWRLRGRWQLGATGHVPATRVGGE
jgi:hypothetical protein